MINLRLRHHSVRISNDQVVVLVVGLSGIDKRFGRDLETHVVRSPHVGFFVFQIPGRWTVVFILVFRRG